MVGILSFFFRKWTWFQLQLDIYKKSALYLFASCFLIGYAADLFPAFLESILTNAQTNDLENFIFKNRAFGPYSWAYWLITFSAILSLFLSQLLWIPKHHDKKWILMGAIVLSLWPLTLERFIIIITSLHRDFLVSSWSFVPWHQWIFGQLISILVFTLLVLFLEYIRNYIKTKNDLPNKA